MNKIYPSALLLLTFLLFFSCNQTSKKMELKNGDILFCSYQNGELSKAIDKVTQTDKSTNYSHMALVEIVNTDTFVIHASLKRGVIKEPLNKFMQIDQPSLVDIYRLKDSLLFAVNKAIKEANSLVGLPYNSQYLMNDTSFYCSQLVYEIFKSDNIFNLEPMTFKNPESGEFNEGWIKYYEALAVEIPEGEPGCNPNGLATSEKLQFIGKLN